MGNLRYPAIPLVTVDPYFSIWSCCDKLYEDVTRHWTGRRQNMLGLIEIDGTFYRFMGKVNADNRYHNEPMCLEQTSVNVYPMSTTYTFENDSVRVTLTFMTPLLTSDLKLMSRPVSYISYRIENLDKRLHNIKLYFGMDCEISVNKPYQLVNADVYEHGVYCGRGNVDVLATTGDDRNIDWGWLHLFSKDGFTPVVHSLKQLREWIGMPFRWDCDMKELKGGDTFSLDDKVAYIALQREFELDHSDVHGVICVAYDDIHSIMYLDKPLDAYYKKDGDTFEDVCCSAIVEYPEIYKRVKSAEKELIQKAEGFGEKYVDIISLAYRQIIAAHKLVWDGEKLLFFSKECYSNGCIGTLDITYPSIPMFLILKPELVEGMLEPLFEYACSEHWNYDFAPHDIGQYPRANGQVYGVDENGIQNEEMQMPIEECGNALICVYALCYYRKKRTFFVRYKDILEKWVDYLIRFGRDPENQLCTDDFAGHLAHNCNLALKAIMGIASYGMLLQECGDEKAQYYLDVAREYALDWEKRACDGNHTRLAFDQEGTWSIKYNAVWDRIFGWNILSEEFYKKERIHYEKYLKSYGVPLDSRSDYAKSDWIMWSARMTDDREYVVKIIEALWNMLNETTSRVPFCDYFYASTARQVKFQHRSVQGGLYILML